MRVPVETRRWWIPWSWSYRQVSHLRWVLRIKPTPSGRAESALSHGAVSPAPSPTLSFSSLFLTLTIDSEENNSKKHFSRLLTCQSSNLEVRGRLGITGLVSQAVWAGRSHRSPDREEPKV